MDAVLLAKTALCNQHQNASWSQGKLTLSVTHIKVMQLAPEVILNSTILQNMNSTLSVLLTVLTVQTLVNLHVDLLKLLLIFCPSLL